jgi:hypothetical protein
MKLFEKSCQLHPIMSLSRNFGLRSVRVCVAYPSFHKNFPEVLYLTMGLNSMQTHGTKMVMQNAFEIFLNILCGVNNPQINGKQEKFHDFYKNHRARFESLDKMISWYNNRPHGALNLRWAETPDEAFMRKMPEVWLSFAFKTFGW